MSQFTIGDYAFLSDMHTSALVSIEGSIDWLPLPRFDSPTYFTKILGEATNGFWKISIKDRIRSERKYLEGTNILETIHHSSSGSLKVLDFLALTTKERILVRQIEVMEGEVTVLEELIPMGEYGKNEPVLLKDQMGGYSFRWEDSSLYYRASSYITVQGNFIRSFKRLKKNEYYFATLSTGSDDWNPSELFQETLKCWRKWTDEVDYKGDYQLAVIRSALILKGLTYAPTGAIVAAPTTSLPETLGGERNWDYRFSWLRDSVFTISAFTSVGHHREPEAFLNWAITTVLKDPDVLSVGYTIDGEKAKEEYELTHLKGFADSRPVRAGNLGFNQFQLDVYGEFMACLQHCLQHKMIEASRDLLKLVERLLVKLLDICDQPDRGIWEIRGEPLYYTYSQAMAWVGLDKGLRLYKSLNGRDLNVQRIESKKDEIRQGIFEKGVDPERKCFTQSFNSTALDAANLRLSLVGFIDAKSEVMENTVNETLKRLTKNGNVKRYLTDDALKGTEGYFITCNYWLVENLAYQGRFAEAKAIFEQTLNYSNDLGLQSEEVDMKGKLLGNFPQAFSHIGLINAATALSKTSSD